ncbi:Der1-like family-domain-containing protein [Calycina marina]|uniref:Derlin n=1 Tax=Calycina marina TaxID=1763456 RepID=A0A9P7Z6Y1_9HELO|nr:Der1-like family-domain-containing protein [Calycina marina]
MTTMSAMDMFWAAPPISRTLAAATLITSVAVYTGIIPYYWIMLYPPLLFKLPPQLWRIPTSFLLTGPQLGMIFDTYFIYTYGSKLETASSRFSQPGDFATYLGFVALAIVALNTFLTGATIFTAALVLALAYTSSQDDRGGKATFFVVTIPSVMVPYAMLLMTLITSGTGPTIVQATGLIAAHLHDFLTRLWPAFGGGRNMLPTPMFVRRLFQTTEATTTNRTYGTALNPAQRAAGAATGASTGGVLPESWRSRGSGHRLGGD